MGKNKDQKKKAAAVEAPKKMPVGLLLAVAALTFVSFIPALTNGFTHWDDNIYVTDNPLIASLSWGNLKAIFTTSHYGVYVPLTMVSYSLEYAVFGKNPAAFHTTNVVLHAVNAGLVFWLFFLLFGGNGPAAFVAAALFGVHPLRVESVAWIAERKDLLCGLFFLMSLISYRRYGESGNRRLLRRSLLLFLCSLLSKPMALTLPFVLLLMDYLASGRLTRKAWTEKIPFFALSLVFAVIALLANQPGDVPPGAVAGASLLAAGLHKAVLAVFSTAFYTVKTLLPFKLAAVYPYTDSTAGLSPALLYASPVILALLAAALVFALRRSRKIVFGLAFFFLTLVPILQLVSLPGNTIVADRYTYIPGLGLAFLAGVLLTSVFANKLKPARLALPVLFAGIILAFSASTFARCRVWRDDRSLWSDVLKKYPDVAVAHDKYGLVLAGDGDQEAAVEEYGRAIALDGAYAGAYNNRAVALRRLKRYDQAAADYAKVIELNPSFADAIYNYGNLYQEIGRNEKAVELYGLAIQRNPKSAPIYNNRGLSYIALNDLEKARADFSKALEIDPAFDLPRVNRGILLVQLGRYAEALEDLDAVVRRNASIPNVYLARGLAWAGQGNFDRALAELDAALRLKPDYEDALNQRIRVWLMKRDGASAAAEIARLGSLGYRIDPELVRAADSLNIRK
jgi:tetratricopeptide (TPR) repeat protein